MVLDHVGRNCGLLKRLKVSFDNPPCLSCRRSAYKWLLQVQTLCGAKTMPGWPSGVKPHILSLSFILYWIHCFSSLLYTLSLSPSSLYQYPRGAELCWASGKLKPGIVHYNQRFPGHVLQGTLSIIAWEHEGLVKSVKDHFALSFWHFSTDKDKFPLSFPFMQA